MENNIYFEIKFSNGRVFHLSIRNLQRYLIDYPEFLKGNEQKSIEELFNRNFIEQQDWRIFKDYCIEIPKENTFKYFLNQAEITLKEVN